MSGVVCGVCGDKVSVIMSLLVCASDENAMSEARRRADFMQKQGILTRKVCSHISWVTSGCGVFSTHTACLGLVVCVVVQSLYVLMYVHCVFIDLFLSR